MSNIRNQSAINHVARAWELLESPSFHDRTDWPEERHMTPRSAALHHLKQAIEAMGEISPLALKNEQQRRRREKNRCSVRPTSSVA